MIYKIYVKGKLLLISLVVVPVCRENGIGAIFMCNECKVALWWQQSLAGSPGSVLTKFKH